MSSGEEFVDLVRDGLADSGDVLQGARLPVGVNVLTKVEDIVGGAAIGEDLETVLAQNVKHVADPLEEIG